jgi:hypothetical protein
VIRFLAAIVEDRRLAASAAGALAIAGGAAAPWARIASPVKPITELGLDADGKITLLCGCVALVLVVVYAFLRQRDLALGAVAFAGIALGLQIHYEITLRDASSRVVSRLLQVPGGSGPSFAVATGAGLWVGLAGAAVVALAMASVALRPVSGTVTEPAAGP